MGIYGERFYFKKGLPKISTIQATFNGITGLHLGFTSSIELKKIADNRDNIIYDINRYEDEEDFISHPDFDGNKSEIWKNRPYINRPYFHCKEFNNIYMGEYSLDEHSFGIECGICNENRYFFKAFLKTMYELGGLHFDYHIYPIEKGLDIEAHLEPYNPHDRMWKNVRKWEEMSAFEKNTFEIFYK